MYYIKKFTIQPSVAAIVLLSSFGITSIGSANAIELQSSSTSQSISNVESTFQKIENNILVEPSTLENEKTSQNVTAISQLSDVKPTDWAFTALQSLVERYGCIAGYPDRTFRGKQATSRYEFAAGLNACLDKVNEVIAAGLADKVSKEDLATLQKLQQEFAAELATLRGRVDALDAKVAKLEAQQFSTTTKLNATIIFALADTFGGVGTGTNTQNPQKTVDGTNANLSYRARLNFDTSFTGKDLLRTRLQSGNTANLGSSTATNTNSARLAFAQNTENLFQIDKFYYKFPVGNSATAYVGVSKLDPDDIADTLNPYFESSDRGALSRFGRYDPLVFRGPSGAGIGFSYKIVPEFTVAASYLANSDTAANATGQAGLFNGGYIANLQAIYAPASNLKFAVAYARSFETRDTVSLAQNTGSTFGNKPFGDTDTSADRYGAQFTWQASKSFNLAGWVGFANARQESGGSNTANLFNWGVTFAFPDLFAEGNAGGIIFGQAPKVTSNTNTARVDPDTSYLLELQYNFRVSKNISITPGIFAVFNPNQNSLNPTTWVTTVRTLFSF
jgi:hypothetical protein